jgi:hypothetical protein
VYDPIACPAAHVRCNGTARQRVESVAYCA